MSLEISSIQPLSVAERLSSVSSAVILAATRFQGDPRDGHTCDAMTDNTGHGLVSTETEKLVPRHGKCVSRGEDSADIIVG